MADAPTTSAPVQPGGADPRKPGGADPWTVGVIGPRRRAPLDAARLWPHQIEAIELGGKVLADGGRATQVLACGTGKTWIAAALAARLAPGGRRLVLAPTVTLLAQSLREYRALLGDTAVGRVVAVCDQDLHTAGQAGLADLHAQYVQVTTDPEVIARAAAGAGPVTVLSTYHSAPAISCAHHQHRLPEWDVLICDEVHRTVTGRTWSRVHDDAFLPARRRLNMTATPRLITGRNTDTDLVGMDDERVFGPTIYRLGYPTAIELGLLARYRMLASFVTDDLIRAMTADRARRTELRLGRTVIPARMLAAQIALLRAAADYGITRAITYHSSIAHARHFAATLPLVHRLAQDHLPGATRPRQVWAEHLAAQHPAELRHDRLQRLGDGVEGGLAVISNARLLSEGVNVPAVDAVLFADPRHSTIDIVQAIGRAIRLGGNPDKTAGIIVPVLTDPGTDPDTAFTGSAYEPIWRVLRALRSHDDDLAAELDQLRRRTTRPGGRPRLPPQVHITGLDLPGRFIDAITLQMVKAATASWEEFYGAACAYRHQHGHLLVPQGWATDTGLGLGTWLHTQRLLRDRGTLRPQRIGLLEAIDMVWSPMEAAWERGYNAAAAYHRRHGHLDVPRPHVTHDGVRLGQWIGVQRTEHNNQKLRPERARRLEELGITWNRAQALRQAAWERGHAAAAAYHRAHGNLQVPSTHISDDGFALGAWLVNLRHRQDTLTADRRAALTELGMQWRDRHQVTWERGYTAAAAYHRQHRHLHVPEDHLTHDGFNLGAWIKTQRARRDQLSHTQRQKLDELTMIWSPRQARWERALTAATTYHQQHGHLRPPVSYSTDDGFRLGDWLAQRRHTGRVTTQQRAQLDALDPDWATPRTTPQPRPPRTAP